MSCAGSMPCPLCGGTITVLVDIDDERRVEIWPDLDTHVCGGGDGSGEPLPVAA